MEKAVFEKQVILGETSFVLDIVHKQAMTILSLEDILDKDEPFYWFSSKSTLVVVYRWDS